MHNDSGKRLMVMAGGTGGHVFPGLAVATNLQQQGWHIHWLGTAGRMEARLVPEAGFDISFIDVVGVRGNGLLTLLAAPLHISRALFQAITVLRHFKPDLVLGMGGFASGPGGLAAWLLRIPLLVHEQNAVPGLTNKLLSKLARKVLTGFDKTFPEQQRDLGSDKYEWVGNPVRQAFNRPQSIEKPVLPINILVVGGSLGAKVLNEQVPQALATFHGFTIRHQCGAGHIQDVQQAYNSCLPDKQNWQVEEFIDDMASAYQWADLLICRAGALTVAEVAAAGVAAIFVPLPHAVDDHQTKNAQFLSNSGAAFLMPQPLLMEGGLAALLQDIFSSPEQLRTVGLKAHQLAKLDSLERVSEICNELVERP
jgi:UDP-N-acetylglucosamine--N-acetylmuramyl-(pentapeptide) pyrophosphoryl-undecaprenol N-acetylglucosamine transferase